MPQNSTTVALIADTHGFLDPRVERLARAASIVVHAGDIGSQAVLEALAIDGARVIAVAGNVDTTRHWPAEEHAALAELASRASIELPGGVLTVEHGDRFPARSRHRRLREAYPDCEAIVCGHSHRRVLDFESRPWVLNPGAAGKSRAHGGPGCLILDAGIDAWRIETRTFEPLRRR